MPNETTPYQRIRNNLGKILIGTGVLVGLSVLTEIGKEVFNGDIDGYHVVYEEGRFHYPIFSQPNSHGLEQNIMTVTRGDTTYKFIDNQGEKYEIENQGFHIRSMYSSDQNAIDYINRVIIKVNNRKIRDIHSSDRNFNSLNEAVADEKLTKQASGIYHQIRLKIRDRNGVTDPMLAEDKPSIFLFYDPQTRTLKPRPPKPLSTYEKRIEEIKITGTEKEKNAINTYERYNDEPF